MVPLQYHIGGTTVVPLHCHVGGTTSVRLRYHFGGTTAVPLYCLRYHCSTSNEHGPRGTRSIQQFGPNKKNVTTLEVGGHQRHQKRIFDGVRTRVHPMDDVRMGRMVKMREDARLPLNMQ